MTIWITEGGSTVGDTNKTNTGVLCVSSQGFEEKARVADYRRTFPEFICYRRYHEGPQGHVEEEHQYREIG